MIASSCIARSNDNQGSFVVTGSGGLQTNPNSDVTLPYSPQTAHAINNVATQPPTQHNSKTYLAWSRGAEIKEATQLIKTQDGRLILAAYPNQQITNTQNLTC